MKCKKCSAHLTVNIQKWDIHSVYSKPYKLERIQTSVIVLNFKIIKIKLSKAKKDKRCLKYVSIFKKYITDTNLKEDTKIFENWIFENW